MNLRIWHLLIVAVFGLIFSNAMLAQPSIYVPITITQGSKTAVDTFGIVSCATYCIDSDLGETELPPTPPSGVFDVRFVDHRVDAPCLGQGIRLHLQPLSRDTFQLQYQKGDGAYNFRISWPAGLNTFWNYLIITDALGFGIINVDMLVDTTVTVTNTGIHALNIISDFIYFISDFEDPCTETVLPDNSLFPKSFALNQNYPNPFNPSTTIKYSVPRTAVTDVAVYDLLGRRVATLISEELRPGYYTATWDGTNKSGDPVSSGVYFVRMAAEAGPTIHFSAFKKLLLVR